MMAESADLMINAATRGDGVLEDNKDFRSSYLLHSKSGEGLMSVVPKTFGCNIDYGEVDEQMVVVSKTMISAKHFFNPMRSLRKQAADYCFLDDCDIPLSDNIVIWATNNYLTKEDMETMVPDKMIMVGVIEWWSLFLNDTCITVDLSILFFGMSQMQPLVRICSPTKDEKTPNSVLVNEVKSSFLTCIGNNKKQCDLNSDLIFIPLHLGDHFNCLCINFIKRKVDYLDNVYKKLLFYGKDSELGMYCHIVLNIMSEFLVENGVPRGAESPSISGAKSTVTSTFEASASVSTPPAGPVSIKGNTPKSLKSVLGSRKRGMADDELGCSLDCEGEDNQILLVSVFMKKNQKLLSKMLKLRKQVVDLCFLDDLALSLNIYSSLLVRDVKFDWKKKEPNDDESGCFMLYTMAQYEGTEFKSDFGVKVSRRSYCAEIATSLILADMNQYRNFVLDNVKKQEPKKTHILSIVSNARKYKVNISATNQDAISRDEVVLLKVVYKVD
ncbi:hypothetical protein KSS87_022229 [Heliosperma pusillum]|nr:hypothetical protein KSS87_022229 [Heliosperma pusillum]